MPRVELRIDEWADPHYAQGTGDPILDETLDLTTPTYVGVAGVEADFIEAHDDLTTLLAELADTPGDVAIWRDDGVLAAVIRGGVATVFETATARPKQDTRKPTPQLFGRAASAIAIWMGKAGWSFSEARGVLLRLNVPIAFHHIGRLVRAGRSGKLRSIRLEAEYVRQLEGLRSLVLSGGT
jgi:hypothetical protein